MSDPFINKNNVPWIRPGQVEFKPKSEPKIDEEVSKIVGKKILVNDRRLINKLIEWKRKKNPDEPDNFLKDPIKREELKQLFN